MLSEKLSIRIARIARNTRFNNFHKYSLASEIFQSNYGKEKSFGWKALGNVIKYLLRKQFAGERKNLRNCRRLVLHFNWNFHPPWKWTTVEPNLQRTRGSCKWRAQPFLTCRNSRRLSVALTAAVDDMFSLVASSMHNSVAAQTTHKGALWKRNLKRQPHCAPQKKLSLWFHFSVFEPLLGKIRSWFYSIDSNKMSGGKREFVWRIKK